jgi:hypothetical protein
VLTAHRPPTEADLELAYVARGEALVACDGARQLAVDTKVAGDALVDEWLALREE